jgi:hypothetical protein
VICDEIDLCDVEFYRRRDAAAARGLQPRRRQQARPRRPRPAAGCTGGSRPGLNGILRVAVGFRGTDTHGLKAFRRASVVDVANACLVDKDLFASELVMPRS